MWIKQVWAIPLLVLVFMLSSCGYHLSGTGGLVPEGTKRIAIPVFINGTNEPYVDVDVTQAVVQEFLVDGRLKVVSPEDAELVLRGKVSKFEAIPISFTANAYVQQYKVRIVVEASLEDLRTKKILWQEKGIEVVFISDYSVAYVPNGSAIVSTPTGTVSVPIFALDIPLTKTSKEAAIQKASRDIAWTLRSRVLEGF